MRRGRNGARRVLTKKLVLSLALLASAAAVVGFGAFATFTGTASTSAAYATGTVSLAPIGTSGANNRLSVGASGLAAGDTIQRAVDLKNTGSISIVSPTLATSASPSSLLDTDTTNGLQLVIDKCSVAWTESGPPYTYTCSGTTSSVVASTPIIQASQALSNITTTSNTDNFLRVTLTLPSGAPNTLQNQSSTITFTFTATQRAAQSQ